MDASHKTPKSHEHGRTSKDDSTSKFGITSISHTSTSNININFRNSARNQQASGGTAKDNDDDSGDEGEDGRISLGSVSSDSLSISHNNKDEDEGDSSEAVSQKEKSSESMADSLEGSKSVKESIEEEIIEEIIEEVVERSSEKDVLQKRRALFGLDGDDQELPKSEKRASLDSSGSSTKENVEPQRAKELSPLHEDVILINNNKVSLNVLKQQQQANSQDTSLNNTTNDISDLAKDNTGAQDESQGSFPTQVRSLEHSLAQPDLSLRGFNSLGTPVAYKLPELEDGQKSDFSVEEDKSIEEMVIENSIEISSKSLSEPNEAPEVVSVDVHAEDRSHSSTDEFREKVKQSSTLQQSVAQGVAPVSQQTTDLDDSDPEDPNSVKKMQRADTFTKEALDDISEESEREVSKSLEQKIERGRQMRQILEANITKRGEMTNETLSSDMLEVTGPTLPDEATTKELVKTMESRIRDLQSIVSSKDVCIAALNSRLEGISRRGSWKGETREDFNIGSGKESSSFTSTIYKDVDQDALCDILDIQSELYERDQLIEKLTEQLQVSVSDREELQKQGELLTTEVEKLKRQLADTLELLKKPPQWKETSSQRLSQVSIDLVSDFDDDEPCDDRPSALDLDIYDQSTAEISQEIENFKKLLKPEELKLFGIVQRKFDDYLRDELEKIRASHDTEIKILLDQLESEKTKNELNLGTLRADLEAKHTQEMEKLRTYFEQKCSDMEKQYSEEVFSQHSRRHSLDTGSDISDQENLPDEVAPGSHPGTPKHKTALLTSPTHRKLTPTSLEKKPSSPSRRALKLQKTPAVEKVSDASQDQMESFYTKKIEELTQKHEEVVLKLRERLQRQNANKSDDELTEGSPRPVLEVPPNYDQEEFHAIVADFERRLQEQVQLAREDVISELEKKFQAFVSDTASAEESDWPREFLLLREQFTARSQLEITQLKIQHEAEMARLKSDYEWRLQQKLKRQTKFDSGRDLDKIITERDTLRELSSTLRWVLGELAKYFSMYESDLNATLMDELQKYVANESATEEDNKNANESVVSNTSRKFVKFAADMSGILTIIEEPSLVGLLSSKSLNEDELCDINVEEILEKLKKEACHLIGLSQQLCKYKELDKDEKLSDKSDSCEEEDGLKSSKKREKSASKSLDDNALSLQRFSRIEVPPTNSLPIFTPEDIANISFEPKSELNVKLHELKNRLVKSEDEKRSLELELAETQSRHESLANELRSARQQIASLESSKEMISEGYGMNALSPQSKSTVSSLSELQERAKTFLSATPANAADNTTQLLQLIEDFCRESDRYFEEGRQDKDDLRLQSEISHMVDNNKLTECPKCEQIEAADKQLKSTRKFLEDQAAEREHERDEFTREIEKLRTLLKDREKERGVHDRREKEVESMKKEIEGLQSEVKEHEDLKLKLESDLKDSVSKIYDLREIIAELESQVDAKHVQEAVQEQKIKELNAYIDQQNNANDTLNEQVESLRAGVDEQAFLDRIAYLEGQLRALRPNGEQSIVLETITDNLKQIENILDRKTKFLESLHADVCSASCSSPSEDVSMKDSPIKKMDPAEPQSLPVDEVQRIMDKLAKHSRAEEAAVKRIKDLEMQIVSSRVSISELQNERDILQERMSEQLVRISSLQSRLDEQRLRAEELHRQGTSDLNIRAHDLQVECSNLKETLTARDNQIKTLNQALEDSKNVIDRLEVELAIRPLNETAEHIQKLENNLRVQKDENELLKDKIKNEMINKLAIPDLIETMLSDKNEEIDHLKEKLVTKEKELQTYMKLFEKQNPSQQKDALDDKVSARTLSDIVSLSEYDEPDQMRKFAQDQRTNEFAVPGASLQGFPMEPSVKNVTAQQQGSSLFGPSAGAHFFDYSVYPKAGTSVTPDMNPRFISFSNVESTNSGTRLARENLLGTPAIIEEITDDGQLSDIQEDNLEEIEELRRNLARLMPLETEMESLKLELDQLTKELRSKSEETSVLAQEKKDLQTEISELRMQVVELQKLEIELKYKAKEVEDMHVRLRAMETQLEARDKEIAVLQDKSDAKAAECETLQIEIERVRKADCTKRLMFQVDSLNQQIESMNKTSSHKDEIIREFQRGADSRAKAERELVDRAKDFSSIEREVVQLREEVNETKQRLTAKMVSLAEAERQVEVLRNVVAQKEELLQNVTPDELLNKLSDEQRKNLDLQEEVTQLKSVLAENGPGNSENTRLYELKQLLEQEMERCRLLIQLRDDLQADFNELKRQFDVEKDNGLKLQMVLDNERKQSNSIQNQDANLIQVLRIRLDAALQNEAMLQDALEKERVRNEGVQRTKSFDNYMTMRSPIDSPKKFHRSTDFESESVARLESEIKLLTAQKDRERERVSDMQTILERERERFEKDISERNEYLENLKREINKLNRDKEVLENELEHAQEKLLLSQREIDGLEQKMTQLQDMDSRRAVRRGREIVESSKTATDLQEVKERLRLVQKERDSLTDVIGRLRQEVEASAAREAKYAAALSQQNADGLVPEQLMEQFREMNRVLSQHSKENHQLVETMQIMSEERRELQRRIVELEEAGGTYFPRTDLEERANHLFGKYLRVESYRKALVHQKRYLLMVLAVHEENEARVMERVMGDKQKRRRTTFRGAVYVIIALERMKYIVRRWQSGKRVATRAIFSTQFAPRRSQSASTNVWTTLNGNADPHNPTSPPCRDRSSRLAPGVSIETLRSHHDLHLNHFHHAASSSLNTTPTSAVIAEFTEAVNN